MIMNASITQRPLDELVVPPISEADHLLEGVLTSPMVNYTGSPEYLPIFLP